MDLAPRAAVAASAALLGFLAVVAASQPERARRETRRLELADLIRDEDARVRSLRDEVRGLEAELEGISRSRGAATGEARDLGEEVRTMATRFGTAGLQGPGVVVTLDDSSAARSPTGDPNDLVVHERDIQTVVNALWAAGAEAVAVNGERLTSSSAVRCAGNTLLLHGSLHSPPYRIAAIGDPTGLGGDLGSLPGMNRLLSAVRGFGLGFSVEPGTVVIPAGAAGPRIQTARAVEAA